METSDAGFLDDLLFLSGYPVGSGQSLVLFGCGIVLLISPTRSLLGGLPHSGGGVAALVDTASFRPTVAGFRGPGNILGVRTFGQIERKRIRLTKKTNVRKRFGVDLWEQPITKRWRADVFLGVVSHGQSVGVVHYGVGSSHLGEPMGCMFRALSEIHARVFWISECG